MKALRLAPTVKHDRTLVLHLPSETPEGPAEVIILVSLVSDVHPESTDIEAFVARAASWRSAERTHHSKADIDRDLDAEREAWDARRESSSTHA